MASNPYVNKVQKADGSVIIDISDTTAVDSDVASGKYFYASNGQKKIGTGANDFVVNLSYDSTEDKWLPVCTFSALASAYNAGKNIVFEATNAVESDVQVSGYCVAEDGTGELLECGYFVVEYDNDNECQYYRSYVFTATGVEGDSKDPYWWAGETTADDSKVLSGYTYVNGNGFSTGTYEPPSPTIQSLTVTPSTSQQTFSASGVDGYKPVTVNAIPSGALGNINIPLPQTNDFYIGIDSSTGVVTAEVDTIASVTPVSQAGYLSTSASAQAFAYGTKSLQLTTQAAQTIHPSTSDQTIASGRYLTGTQTIKAVTTTNLTAENIKSGVVVEVGDSTDSDCVTKITGTYSGGGGSVSYDTKTVTASNYPVSLEFSSMKGQPKFFVVRLNAQVSSSGSTTYYYIVDIVSNGTTTHGNCFRIGSTRRVDNITSGYSWSYSGTTLTITSSATSRSASPGAFYSGSYELMYAY